MLLTNRRNRVARQASAFRKIWLEEMERRDLLANDLSLSASAIDENVAAHSAVGTFSMANATQAGENFTYSLVGGTGSEDNARFTINGDELDINTSPNFEADASYNVLVQATGDQGTTTQHAFTITVNDVAQESGQILTGFDPTSGTWFGSQLQNGTSQTLANWNPAAGWQDGVVGDFNGDGNMDIAARTAKGRIWVGLSDQDGSGNLFNNVSIWGGSPASVDTVKVADVNADGKDDLIVGGGAKNNRWFTFTSTGTTFDRQVVNFSSRVQWTDLMVADFNGDGRTDIGARIDAGTDPSAWWVRTANANGTFNAGTRWARWAGVDWQNVTTADMNGDSKLDLVGRNPTTGKFQLSQSQGTNFALRDLGRGTLNSTATFQNVIAADLNGDGRDELVGQDAVSGELFRLSQQGNAGVFTDLGTAALDDTATFAVNVNADAADEIFRRSASTGAWNVNALNPAGTSLDPLNDLNFQPTWDQAADFAFSGVGQQDGSLL